MKPRGSMLILALWTLALLGAFAVSLGFGVRQKASLLSRLSTLDAVYPIAYSGVEQARSFVKADEDTSSDHWKDTWARRGPGTEGVVVAEGKFSLLSEGPSAVVDEERKVNLNNTSVEILSRLLESVADLKMDGAQEMAYNLMDWMDPDSFFGHPQYGAETSYYESLPKPYSAKDLPYEVPDEILLVKGMTPQIFEMMRPYVTIYGTGQVNINTADPKVLSALGISKNGVDLIMQYRAGSDEKEGTSDDLSFSSDGTVANALKTVESARPLDESDAAKLDGLVAEGRIGVNATAFSVLSRGTLNKNGAFVDVEAVFNRQGQILYQRAGEVQWPALT